MPNALPIDIAGRRIITREEEKIVASILQEFSEKTTWRNTIAAQWEEAAALVWPEYRNTFFYGSNNFPGAKKTSMQVDATGMLALHRFAAICDSLLTPANSQWHALEANDDYVMKDRDTRLYFDQVTKLLFKYRNDPISGFRGQNSMVWRSLGAFGNGTMFIDAFDSRDYRRTRGARYKAVPLGETFFGENHQGIIDRMFRWFRLTAYQAAQKWGESALPVQLHSQLERHSEWKYNFLHCVKPRHDYDPGRYDAKGLPFSSHYVSVEGMCLMQPESGYQSFPFATARYDNAPNEVYARGPTQLVLPALKTINAQKTVHLKVGHRGADPVLLMADDGISGMDLRPGAQNKGGVTSDGKLLVHTLPTGNITISEKMMAEEARIIDDMFLVSLYKVLSDHPDMTATQVIELVNEKGILVAPVLGRQTDYLAAMIDRELDVFGAQGMLPPMPDRLREAHGSYNVVWTSPLALQQKGAGAAAGFIRTVETSKEIVNITQDPSFLDWADFDSALPEIARNQGTFERWMASPEKIAARRKSRADAQAQQQQIQALPAQAAILKAQATVAKSQPGIQPGQAA